MDITGLLQTKIKLVVDALTTMHSEVVDIGKAYWATDANVLVVALTNDTDAATLTTKLTKAEYVAGVTLCSEMADFFDNAAVSTADYIVSCNKLRYGSHATGAKLSEATEQLGTRMNLVALNCVELFKIVKDILSIYVANEVGDMIANIDAQRHVPGSQMTRDELNSGIALVEQFKKMMNNEAVTPGDYATTLSQWQVL